jgi:hypothetical protein
MISAVVRRNETTVEVAKAIIEDGRAGNLVVIDNAGEAIHKLRAAASEALS